MNTNTQTFAENHIAYENMILSEEDRNIDPTLMEGYVDNLDQNAAAMMKSIENEKKAAFRGIMFDDLKMFAVGFIGCVVLGSQAINITSWIATFF